MDFDHACALWQSSLCRSTNVIFYSPESTFLKLLCTFSGIKMIVEAEFIIIINVLLFVVQARLRAEVQRTPSST